MSQLSPEQERALDAIHRWIQDKDQWMFHLGGFAGTGKTFLLQHFINNLDKPPLCLAPTGKAASVLQKRLPASVRVCTIHSVLYKPVSPSSAELAKLEQALVMNPGNETIIKALKEEKEKLAKKRVGFASRDKVDIVEGDLVIVDECSMVTNKMAADLQATGAKVLFVGDPGQLPPVGDSGFFVTRKPEAMLETIQRQALDSPIIRLSARIRNDQGIPPLVNMEKVKRMPRTQFPGSAYRDYEQILTGTNRYRINLNRHMRKLRGYTDKVPMVGERLICLKNDTKAGKFYINGVQCYCADPMVYDEKLGEWFIGLDYEGVKLPHQPVYAYHFEAYWNKEASEEPMYARDGLVELDYGYAITVHKSQGSEWDSVVLVDDNMSSNDRAFRKRWMYTAVTRAKDKLVWLYG